MTVVTGRGSRAQDGVAPVDLVVSKGDRPMMDVIRRGKSLMEYKTIETLLGHNLEEDEAALRILGRGAGASTYKQVSS